MPTYEYACTRCGTHVEVFQRFGDEPLRECGVCGGELRKVFHPAGIVFKGSGFYATDSRTSGKSRQSEGSEGTKGEGKGEGAKGEGKKPEAKGGGKKPEATASPQGPKEKSA